jgi:hypothetical protein
MMLITLAAAAFWACGGSEPTATKHYTNLEEVSMADWKALAGKKIYFGHQSVGYNILDGVAAILAQRDGAELTIVEVENELPDADGYFAHGRVGENTHPDKKIAAFEAFMAANAEAKPDIAFFKFCYVDIREDADVDAIFKQYVAAMDRLEKEYSDTRFLHVTVPIMQNPTGYKGFKQWVRGLLGKTRYGVDGNIKRNHYNDLLRRKYQASGNLFDLALHESTRPDGTREGFEDDGKQYETMVPEYTNDGGHLNETGQRVIGEKLLLFLM